MSRRVTDHDLPILDDERLLWRGSPPTGLRFSPSDTELIPFSIFWAGFAGFFNYAAWATSSNWLMRLWGMPFLVVAIHIVVGRFFVDAWVRRRQRYFVTDKRAVILRTGWRGDIRSVGLDRVPFLATTERSDGSGDLRLGPLLFKRGKYGRKSERGRWMPALSPTPQFLGIPDVAAVRSLIERTAGH
jgi:hypothetical protein